MSEVSQPLENRIREKAYSLWEADGRPEGRSEEYWQRACGAWDISEHEQPPAQLSHTTQQSTQPGRRKSKAVAEKE
jgi:hypothetical protein